MKFVIILAIVGVCFAADEFDSVSSDLKVADIGRGGRIVNGSPALANQFPHQALVFILTGQGSFQCGGSLISQDWVLSAAHCIIGAVQVQVLLGSTNRNAMPVKRYGAQIVRLGSYNPSTLRDDISLIKFSQPVSFTANVKAIQLPALSQASATLQNEILTVSGFGLTTSNQVATNLQYTRVIGISNTECRSIYGSMIISSILCTRGYPNTNAGSCSGDSGGPLIKDSAVYGIVSFGAAQSCTAGLPQGFTRVGSYVKWISSVTGIPVRN